LVFASSFVSGAFSPVAGAPASPPGVGVAGAGSTGAGAGAGSVAGGGGGGGGAGSSFLPHPAIARVKVKRDIPDIKTIFLPIISSPPFASHINKNVLSKQFLLHNSVPDARLFSSSSAHAAVVNDYSRQDFSECCVHHFHAVFIVGQPSVEGAEILCRSFIYMTQNKLSLYLGRSQSQYELAIPGRPTNLNR
jgi:hypothetical protein